MVTLAVPRGGFGGELRGRRDRRGQRRRDLRSTELEQGIAFRQSIPADLSALLKQLGAWEILGGLEIVRIPLDLYRARNATSQQLLGTLPSDNPFATSPVFLAGDSAIGSPYFQSISLGFECAMFLAGLIARREPSLRDKLDRYELYIYKQWLRVYMRSKMIKHNKDLFQSLDEPLELLEKLHI